MAIDPISVSRLVELAGAFFQICEMADAYEERKLERQSSETAISALYRLYRQGKMSQQDFLKALDPILKTSDQATKKDLKTHLLKIVDQLPD